MKIWVQLTVNFRFYYQILLVSKNQISTGIWVFKGMSKFMN